MNPTIRIDARDVVAQFSPGGGIPEGVRNNLRRVLPDLTKRLGNRVEDKLNTQLKSRRRLKVDKLLREDPKQVIGQVSVRWTGSPEKSFIPQILESGAKAHPIYPKNARALSFFWERIGRQVMFAKVWHPGFPGIRYMQTAFQEMEDEIIRSISRAVTDGANSRAA